MTRVASSKIMLFFLKSLRTLVNVANMFSADKISSSSRPVTLEMRVAISSICFAVIFAAPPVDLMTALVWAWTLAASRAASEAFPIAKTIPVPSTAAPVSTPPIADLRPLNVPFVLSWAVTMMRTSFAISYTPQEPVVDVDHAQKFGVFSAQLGGQTTEPLPQPDHGFCADQLTGLGASIVCPSVELPSKGEASFTREITLIHCAIQ